jgi:F-type H+-transporting ATPase subunit delta
VSEQPRALARRYAKALFEVAGVQGAALERELGELVSLIEGSDELRRALLGPTLRSAARRRLVEALAESGQASPLLRRLLVLLAERDRLALLPTLAEEFAETRNAREGRVSAEAVTAVPLAEPQRAALASALSKAVGKQVQLKARVDAALLGGVLVRLEGRSYDGSVRGRLAALRARLVSGS